MDNVPTPEQTRAHRAALLGRITVALDPSDARERQTLHWLSDWGTQQLEDLATMGERTRRRAFADGAAVGRAEILEEWGGGLLVQRVDPTP
ncbi:MAG TPA: hypothetical protein VIP77_04400 [Jiangellaceae bacterium]